MISDSFKLSHFKARRTLAIHLHIRHMSIIHIFLNRFHKTMGCNVFVLENFIYFLNLFSGPVCNFMRFDKTYFRRSGWDVLIFFRIFLENYAFQRFLLHFPCTLSEVSRTVNVCWYPNPLYMELVISIITCLQVNFLISVTLDLT